MCSRDSSKAKETGGEEWSLSEDNVRENLSQQILWGPWRPLRRTWCFMLIVVEAAEDFWAGECCGLIHISKGSLELSSNSGQWSQVDQMVVSRGGLLQRPSRKDFTLALSVHCLWENIHLLKSLKGLERLPSLILLKVHPSPFFTFYFRQPKLDLSESSEGKVMVSSNHRGWPSLQSHHDLSKSKSSRMSSGHTCRPETVCRRRFIRTPLGDRRKLQNSYSLISFGYHIYMPRTNL